MLRLSYIVPELETVIVFTCGEASRSISRLSSPPSAIVKSPILLAPVPQKYCIGPNHGNLVQTYSDWSRLVKTCPKWSRLDQTDWLTCPGLSRIIQTDPDLARLVKTPPHLS